MADPSLMPDPKRILLVRPSALGDVCRTVPVLAALRTAFPRARIDWLVQDSFVDAVASHPALTAHGGGVLPFPRKRFGRLWNPKIGLELAQWLDALHAAHYDLAIDAQGLLRSAIFTGFTGAGTRIGYSNAREAGRLAYTHAVYAPPDWHAVGRMLHLLTPLGISVPHPDMRLYAPPAARDAVASDARFGGRFAVFAPTTRWPSKQWPAGRFVDLARGLLDGGQVDRVVLVGARGEEPQCAELLTWAGSEPRAVNLIGQTTLGELMAVIGRSAILIGSDSAAVHMAVGFGRPLVALYGPTVAAFVGPFGRDGDVISRVHPGEVRDHKADEPGGTQMARITTQEVLGACKARLGGMRA
ncbi:MAG: glycosyltransferase family 9 protein [bacterium]